MRVTDGYLLVLLTWCYILRGSPVGVPLTPQPRPQKPAAKLLNHPTNFQPISFDWPWILKQQQQERSVVCLECKVQRIGWLKNSLWAKCGVLTRPAVQHIAELHSNYRINNDYVTFTSFKESRIWDASVLLLSSFPHSWGSNPGLRHACYAHALSLSYTLKFKFSRFFCDHLDLTFKTLRVINYEV